MWHHNGTKYVWAACPFLCHLHHSRSFKVSYISYCSFILQVFIPITIGMLQIYNQNADYSFTGTCITERRQGEHRAGRHEPGGHLEWEQAHAQLQQQQQKQQQQLWQGWGDTNKGRDDVNKGVITQMRHKPTTIIAPHCHLCCCYFLPSSPQSCPIPNPPSSAPPLFNLFFILLLM